MVESNPFDKNMHSSLYLILNIIQKGCLEAGKIMEEIDKLDPNNTYDRLEKQGSLFRSEFSVCMSAQFFIELTKALEYFVDFLEGDMSEDNLLEQYQFYCLASLVKKSLETCERLEIPMKSMLKNEEDFEKFMKLIDVTVCKVADPGIAEGQFVSGNADEEMKCLWEE
jgi:hypothetical protein